MPIDPAIPLAVKVPEQASPIQTIGGLMQIRDAASQIALRNAQTQASQQQAADVAEQTAQRRRENQSTLQLQELMKNPDVQAKAATGDFSSIYNAGISPTVANAAIKNIQDQRTTAQAIEKDKLGNYITQRGLLKDMLQGVSSESDDATSAAQYNSGRENLMRTAPDLAKNLPILQPGQNYRQQLDALVNTNGFHQSILQDAASLAKTNAETTDLGAKTNASNAEAALSTAKTPGAAAESQKQQLTTQLMQQAQQNPGQGAALIDSALPASVDSQANASYKAAWQAAMQSGNVEGAAKIVGVAADHAASITKALNPQIQQQEVNKAVKIAQATAPIEIGKAIATAKALRQGDNPAVAGVPPAAVAKVQTDAIKLDQDQLKANAATESLGTLLDLAEKGNKAAGSGVPLVGVETLNAINGIKRVNSAEISQYGSAGSLLDRIQGQIGKLTVGQPIPKDVLNDIRELHQQLGQSSYRQYTGGLDSLNQRTGAKFSPTVPPPNITRGGGVTVADPRGVVHSFKTQQDADAFKKAAGIQ